MVWQCMVDGQIVEHPHQRAHALWGVPNSGGVTTSRTPCSDNTCCCVPSHPSHDGLTEEYNIILLIEHHMYY